jgi:hypothetical protein
MARNQARDYATMDEDERRRFQGAAPSPDNAAPSELDFTEPRDEDRQGHSQVDRKAELADSEHRDGLAAQLDDEAHDDAVRDAP